MNSPQKLMLVEQDIQTARTLRDALKTGFSEVQVAFDGATAARELAARQADFIVVDKDTVPRIDYADLFRELRPAGSTPLLVLSSSRDVLERVRALDAGADDFLEKPIDTRDDFQNPRHLAPHADAAAHRCEAVAPEICGISAAYHQPFQL